MTEEQRDVFLASEADRYFERNPTDFEACLDDPWNDHLAGLVPNGGSVLEIGCADGRRLAAIGEIAGPRIGALCGVDPSAEAVRFGSSRWPDLDLRIGTADQVPFDSQFDVVVFGFCLYLCDRSLLHRAIAEGDRLTADGGALAIIDFDPPTPRRRPYRHLEGVWSWKMDYPALLLADPAYSLDRKLSGSHDGDGWVRDGRERIALTILRKARADGYEFEAETH